MKQQHGQTIVEIVKTEQNFSPFNDVSFSDTSRLAEVYPQSPIHDESLTDIERSGKFVQNLTLPSVPGPHTIPPISVQDATAYWGFDHVNIKFGVNNSSEDPDIYRPPGFYGALAWRNGKVRPPHIVGLEPKDMGPLGNYVPDITISSLRSDVPAPVHPASAVTSPGAVAVVQQIESKYDKASPENKVTPAAAIHQAQSDDNSALVEGLTLGKYLLGKSGYTFTGKSDTEAP